MLITAILSALIFAAVAYGWSSDRRALRQTQAALGAVQAERDAALVGRNTAVAAGKLAYATGHAHGLKAGYDQAERERQIKEAKERMDLEADLKAWIGLN